MIMIDDSHLYVRIGSSGLGSLGGDAMPSNLLNWQMGAAVVREVELFPSSGLVELTDGRNEEAMLSFLVNASVVFWFCNRDLLCV